MSDVLDRLPATAGLAVGALPVAVLALDGVRDRQLLAVLALLYAVAGWLVARRWRIWRSTGSPWTGLLVVVLIGGAQFGLHADLPIDDGLTETLWYLVFGVGLAAAAVGVEMAASVVTRRRDRPRTAD